MGCFSFFFTGLNSFFKTLSVFKHIYAVSLISSICINFLNGCNIEMMSPNSKLSSFEGQILKI